MGAKRRRIEAICPKPHLSRPGPGHRIYPYLLRNVAVLRPDQGSQYTAEALTGRLQAAGVAVSMDGGGRWLDNVFAERLWPSVKYELVYLHDYATPRALEQGPTWHFPFYNERRIHEALDYSTPAAVYRAGRRSPLPKKTRTVVQTTGATSMMRKPARLG